MTAVKEWRNVIVGGFCVGFVLRILWWLATQAAS